MHIIGLFYKQHWYNHVNEAIYKQAHQTSARFEAHESEFTKTGLTEFYSSNLKAPYVAESLVKIGLTFEEEIPIKSNNTILIIGKVVELMLNEDYLTESYLLDLSKTQNISVQGLETYYRSEKIAELAYAKTDLNVLTTVQL